MRMVSLFGAGILIGAALIVIIPEVSRAFCTELKFQLVGLPLAASCDASVEPLLGHTIPYVLHYPHHSVCGALSTPFRVWCIIRTISRERLLATPFHSISTCSYVGESMPLGVFVATGHPPLV
jgi:hypothetical protein